MNHDVPFVHEVQRLTAQHIKEKYPAVETVHYFSDGCAKRYKITKICGTCAIIKMTSGQSCKKATGMRVLPVRKFCEMGCHGEEVSCQHTT